MHATTTTTTTRSILVLLLSLATLSIVVEVVQAKELVATHEWQRVGPGDTLPAGLEIRMDLEHGGTWVRIPPTTTQEEEEQQQHHQQHPPHVHRCGPSCHERLAARKRGIRGGGGGNVAAAAAAAAAATTTAGETSGSTTGNAISNHTSSTRQVAVQGVFLVLVAVTLVGLLLMFWKSRGPKLREL